MRGQLSPPHAAHNRCLTQDLRTEFLTRVLVVCRGPSGGPPPASGILDVEEGEALERQAAVLRLQAEGDALLHLLTAPHEPAAVPGQLLPGAPAVLLPLTAAGKELLHLVTETNLTGRGGEEES